jgi:hypothetical protein
MTILFAGKIADIIGEIDSFSDKYYSTVTTTTVLLVHA